jgi:hypothetical protein
MVVTAMTSKKVINDAAKLVLQHVQGVRIQLTYGEWLQFLEKLRDHIDGLIDTCEQEQRDIEAEQEQVE